ncbi:protein MULTIPOLAR SPINDLE 1-like isoform X1 [Lycium ferocissimum]|uniref:protein MULTIPOLAR SPINDLE 1-like isoform X1 n=1 Tax=Lycium ferocissimum TaxID=112874 RepID=UPI0028162C70|nr:protein MULTIPOLAR SPINDLE 1-like isoform X1 [Lycium ferocissimum]
MEKVRSEQEKSKSDESLKLAVAMAIVRSNLLHKSPAPPPQPSSSVDALKWKQKAKERKREILRLKEDLKVAEDGSQCDIYPKSASCKCYFFDKLGSTRIGDGSDQRFSDVLRRRFLRQVRIKERKTRRTDDSLLQRISERDSENNVEQLSASVDFLLELCDTISPQSLDEGNFKNWCHQAVDFILGTLATMSPMERNAEPVEGIINSLIMRLLRRMCSALQGDENHHFDTAVQFYIQHLMRKIGNEAFVGLRLIFAVSQRISVVAESLLFMDPFDVAYPSMHNSMYMMIQLIEFLVSDYLLTWSNAGDFDIKLFEEWVGSILHGRKALELLENRNSLYVLYIDRVIGVVTRQVGQLSFQQKLNPQILENLFS